MKRFYSSVEIVETDGDLAVTLDGRPVRTPGKRALAVPYRSLAEAVADEWRRQGESVELSVMRLTRFANTALDLVSGRREEVIRQVAAYAATDLLCYRATEPPELVRRQVATWDPLLDWMAQWLGVRLAVADGIVPCRQDDRALLAVTAAVATFDSFPLTALHMATAATGSVVIGLALAHRRLDAAGAAAAAQLDEIWQAERWGSDAEAERRRAAVHADIEAAAEFFILCREGAPA